MTVDMEKLQEVMEMEFRSGAEHWSSIEFQSMEIMTHGVDVQEVLLRNGQEQVQTVAVEKLAGCVVRVCRGRDGRCRLQLTKGSRPIDAD